MVDFTNFTNYGRTYGELEEMALGCVLVAGKNAATTAKLLDNMLSIQRAECELPGCRPFECFMRYTAANMAVILRDFGFGCYRSKGRSVYELVHSGLNLRTCSIEDLEAIHGIGPKTARMFVLHSRRDATCAVLDVHILHYLSDLGYTVPRTTPGSKKKYREVELICQELARRFDKSMAVWDLAVWNLYSKKPKQPLEC